MRIGPEASVRQSAALLGLGGEEAADPAVDFGLATLDLGNWHGVAPEQLAAEQLGPWFADPVATPHGGESVADFVARIRAHVAGLPDEAVLVVATPVAQALLCPGPEAFFATDIAPAAHYRL